MAADIRSRDHLRYLAYYLAHYLPPLYGVISFGLGNAGLEEQENEH